MRREPQARPDFTVLIAHSIDSMKAAFAICLRCLAILRPSYSPGCCPELDELYSSTPQASGDSVRIWNPQTTRQPSSCARQAGEAMTTKYR
jgi:hypothetical protein